MRSLLLIICSGIASLILAEPSRPQTPREEVRQLLAADFTALNRGKKTLSDVGKHACTLARTSRPEVRKVLLAGALRLFTRAGDTNGLAAVRLQMEDEKRPFVQRGNEAVLRLGQYGELSFVRCPPGTVEVILSWRGTKSAKVTLTRPFWIMKYPITRQEAAFYPPLDGNPTTRKEPEWTNYVCPNRSTVEDLIRYFTDRFRDVLPEGYEIRLPTLAEWELAFHAGATEGDFADLRRIHHHDEVGMRIYYDYDTGEMRRKKQHNAWGIGDWCPQEKVMDVIDATKLVKSPTDPDDSFQIQELPMPTTTTNPVGICKSERGRTLIRMPSWARWNGSARGYDRDGCPFRLAIAPKLP